MSLDLGSRAQLDVTVDGKTHPMRMPTVMEAKRFQDKLATSEENEIELICKLIQDLGLPEDVTASLDINQFKKLSEGLMGLSEKK